MTPVSVCVHPIARRGPGRRGKNSGCRGLEPRWTRQPLLARPVHGGHGSVESEDVQTPDDEGGRMRPRELVSTARVVLCAVVALSGCKTVSPPADRLSQLIAKGRDLFFNETFAGNGRTCGTCHPAENNFTIDPAFIATLPKDNPLFVAEFNPDLKENFENPALMREFGLILENLDGFDDLKNKFVMRGVPHTLGLRTSVQSPGGPRTGWSGAGATANFPGRGSLGNANFNTGVEDLPDQPARLTGKRVPPDDGFRSPGDGTFNIPPLVEAADTGPFFHNNAIETIEGAVGFYDGEAFNNSPAGQALAKIDPNGKGIELDGTQIVAIAAFLRVINVLENIRQSIELLETSRAVSSTERAGLLARAARETDDSIRVLRGGGLHAEAVAHLREARRLEDKAVRSLFFGRRYAQEAIREQKKARAFLVE